MERVSFCSWIRAIALEKRASDSTRRPVPQIGDFTPTGGQARNLYAELMRNLSTRTKPDGNALTSVVERFITEARKQADASSIAVTAIIEKRLSHLSELVGGYDFAKVIAGLTGAAMNKTMSS